ncbi:MAG TPA: hypothetical protein VI685_06630 [Candidatus Angelobacter sp.]
MNDLETLDTVEQHSDPVSAVLTLPVGRKEEQSEPRSFSVSLRNAVKRFVAWIDGVDVDGQQYWN